MGIVLPELPPKQQDANAPKNASPVNAANPEGNWTDAARHTITRSGHGLWNNYDDTAEGFFPGQESWRVGIYAPIDLLKMNDGTPVVSADFWWKKGKE